MAGHYRQCINCNAIFLTEESKCHTINVTLPAVTQFGGSNINNFIHVKEIPVADILAQVYGFQFEESRRLPACGSCALNLADLYKAHAELVRKRPAQSFIQQQLIKRSTVVAEANDEVKVEPDDYQDFRPDQLVSTVLEELDPLAETTEEPEIGTISNDNGSAPPNGFSTTTGNFVSEKRIVSSPQTVLNSACNTNSRRVFLVTPKGGSAQSPSKPRIVIATAPPTLQLAPASHFLVNNSNPTPAVGNQATVKSQVISEPPEIIPDSAEPSSPPPDPVTAVMSPAGINSHVKSEPEVISIISPEPSPFPDDDDDDEEKVKLDVELPRLQRGVELRILKTRPPRVTVPAGGPPYKCKECDKSYLLPASYRNHIISHMRAREFEYPCSDCNYEFQTAEDLQDHRQTVHEYHGVVPFRKIMRGVPSAAAKSSEGGRTTEPASQQRRSDGLPLTFKIVFPKVTLEYKIPSGSNCPYCGKGFSSSKSWQQLKDHMRLKHLWLLGDKNMTCPTCSKVFARKNHAKYHAARCGRPHTRKGVTLERKFACDQCQKLFTSKVLVEKHKAERCGRLFTCEICGLSYRKNAHLVSHMVAHATERPFFCEKCGRNYKSKQALFYHQKIAHTEEGRLKFNERMRIKSRKRRLAKKVDRSGSTADQVPQKLL